ncbi:hypothetical protein V5799_030574 [Amblyomma americanum]|uniref:Uncharacterized protein n=1 Tax=Amblyomma americanum TaxID=6943 RepID=A0AAQ4EMQ7_AMBAM
MQPGRGCQWTIKLPSSDYLLPTAAGGRHGKGPKAGSGGEPPPWSALHGYVQLMCRDKRMGPGQPSQQQQQLQQLQQHRHKQRMAPGTSSPAALADVVTAGAYYAAAASPGAATAATALYWQQQQLQQQAQHEDTYVSYRGTAADAFVFQQQASSFVPCREMRAKNGCFGFRQAMFADGDGFYAPSDDTGFVAQQELHSFHPFLLQEHPQQQQQEHEWAQHSYLPYDDDALGASGQGDGDAPVYGGGAVGGAPEDFDLMFEEQDEVVAMLIEVDRRHEKHLAFERVLQQRQTCFGRNRRRATLPQLQLQRERIMYAADSSDSVDVCVDAALWRSVSDSSLDYSVRDESSFRAPSTKIQIRAPPDCCQSALVAAADDDKVSATVRVSDSPLPPHTTTPSPTTAVADAATPSASPNEGCTEAAEEAATGAPEAKDKDANHVPAESKDGGEARNEEKVSPPSPSSRPASSQNQEEEGVHPTAGCKPPQPQEPANAAAAQQRKAQDFKRPAHARREYHSTRRYNEPDQATPPLMGKAPGAGRQLKTDSPIPQKGQCKEPAGNNRRISPSDDVYARGQQQPARGGCHSASRNRNRSNRQVNGHNQWNKDRARPDNPDGGNRGGGAAANRNPVPYSCQKGTGASRRASPADTETPTPPPAPPPSRGRHYNNKQNAGDGGQTQVRRQFSNPRPGPQPATPPAAAAPAAPRAATACNNTNRSPTHKNKAPATGNTPCPSRRSRRQQQKQRSDYNQPRNGRVNALAADTSPRHGSRDCQPPARGGGADASPDGTDDDLPDDGSRRRSMSLKGLWEKTNLTIFRRRTSQ